MGGGPSPRLFGRSKVDPLGSRRSTEVVHERGVETNPLLRRRAARISPFRRAWRKVAPSNGPRCPRRGTCGKCRRGCGCENATQTNVTINSTHVDTYQIDSTNTIHKTCPNVLLSPSGFSFLSSVLTIMRSPLGLWGTPVSSHWSARH